jgi:hypothetical protein
VLASVSRSIASDSFLLCRHVRCAGRPFLSGWRDLLTWRPFFESWAMTPKQVRVGVVGAHTTAGWARVSQVPAIKRPKPSVLIAGFPIPSRFTTPVSLRL